LVADDRNDSRDSGGRRLADEAAPVSDGMDQHSGASGLHSLRTFSVTVDPSPSDGSSDDIVLTTVEIVDKL
jgi:hypothetical protein